MQLKPVIASYSGQSFTRIREYLDTRALEVVAAVARAPRSSTELPEEVLAELVEMHVLKESEGGVTLDTSVFLREDIEQILEQVTPLAEELARRVAEHGGTLRTAPPEITLFLGGVVGLVQGLGLALRQENVGADWKNYTGRYAQSKVDFDELCEPYEALGPDYLNKTILPGEAHTAVFIGFEEGGFWSLLRAVGDSAESRRYVGSVNRYLVDAYARLVKGELESEALRPAAEAANLLRGGQLQSAVITREVVRAHAAALEGIIEGASAYYIGELETLDTLLRATTPGRQGVPPANMMLNLWRYVRKLTARALYANGFFTDTLPEIGLLTVFYENDVEVVQRLFG